MNMPFDLLVRSRAFEIWAVFWSQHADAWPGVNTATSTAPRIPWLLTNGAQIRPLLLLDPGDLFRNLQTLIKHDLVDTFWLMIYPVTSD